MKTDEGKQGRSTATFSRRVVLGGGLALLLSEQNSDEANMEQQQAFIIIHVLSIPNAASTTVIILTESHFSFSTFPFSFLPSEIGAIPTYQDNHLEDDRFSPGFLTIGQKYRYVGRSPEKGFLLLQLNAIVLMPFSLFPLQLRNRLDSNSAM
jgi:hypothetical protein